MAAPAYGTTPVVKPKPGRPQPNPIVKMRTPGLPMPTRPGGPTKPAPGKPIPGPGGKVKGKPKVKTMTPGPLLYKAPGKTTVAGPRGRITAKPMQRTRTKPGVTPSPVKKPV